MGELGKVVRWSAPGSVFIMVVAIVLALSRLILGQEWWSLGSTAHLVNLPKLDGGLVAVVVAASVPIGFLLYQVYYFSYSRPQGFVLSFVHLDVALRVRDGLGKPLEGVEGASVWRVRRTSGLYVCAPRHYRLPMTGRLSTLWLYQGADKTPIEPSRTPGEVVEPLPEEQPLGIETLRGASKETKSSLARQYHKVLKDYARQRERNWLALESHLHERLRDKPGCERDFKDIEKLADVYHTLGAAKTAVALGWMGGNTIAIWPFLMGSEPSDWPRFVMLQVVTSGVTFALAAVLYIILHENRRHCASRRVAFITAALDGDVAAPGGG